MKKLFIIPIIFFVCLLLFFYLLMPKYIDFKKVADDVAKRESKLYEEETELLELQGIAKQLEAFIEPLAKIESALPDSKSFAGMLNLVEEKAAESGLILKSFAEARIKIDENEEPVIKRGELARYTADLTGYFAGLENLIRGLERSSRLIEIKDINVKRSKELLDFLVTMQIYSY